MGRSMTSYRAEEKDADQKRSVIALMNRVNALAQ